MIRTVTNDIEKEELGITMCHEHFIVDLDRVRHDGISKIETVEEVEPEIQQMRRWASRPRWRSARLIWDGMSAS
ncbi:MAG: hypothetical protein ACLSA6_07765 [Holdemania massiliensis]